MNRKLDELVAYLFRELSFPQGVFLLTGTGIVPPEQFTLAHGDLVTITIGDLTLAQRNRKMSITMKNELELSR